MAEQALAQPYPAQTPILEAKVSPSAIDPAIAEMRTELRLMRDEIEALKERVPDDKVTIIGFSGDMDRLMAAFIVATGAAVMGMETTIFFTFWGLTALKKKTVFRGKKITEKLLTMMLPSGPGSVGTSKMNMMGMGPKFFGKVMRDNNVQTLPELVELAQDLEVRLVACQMSMGVMGITREELIDGVEYAGVAAYLDQALDSRVTLQF